MDRTRREFIVQSIAVGTALAALGTRQAQGQDTQRAMPGSNQGTKTLMSLFDLKYPIFQAPTATVAGADVTIAVSSVGALGGIGLTWTPPDIARGMVTKIKAATNRPFAVNYVLVFEPASLPAVLEAGAPIIQFSWGMPNKQLVSAVRTSGARLGVQVTSAGSARQALDLGADYLVCQGTEAGGHVQAHRPLLEALAEVLAEAKQTPVVASGGIGNGEGIRKVLMGGASAAMLGTRFVATQESWARPDYKAALTQAKAGDTALTVCFEGGWPNALHRVLRNPVFERWESAGCPPVGKRPGEGEVVGTFGETKINRYSTVPPLGIVTGSRDNLCLYAGQSVEHIKDIPAAGELVERLWAECLGA
jgi:nitronate monooxygenase